MISLFKREERKTLPPIPSALLSFNRKRKNSVVLNHNDSQRINNNPSAKRMLSTFTKVVRAISILKTRAGVSRLSSANEQQVKIINDWSYVEATVANTKKVNKRYYLFIYLVIFLA
jgi:hypothetical protein